MDVCTYRYPSRRNVVFGMNGMVCTSQPLAAQAGLEVLRKGGNAMDAAVATAACMTVLEPTSNGLGSDAFAIIYSATDHKLHGLNASADNFCHIRATVQCQADGTCLQGGQRHAADFHNAVAEEWNSEENKIGQNNHRNSADQVHENQREPPAELILQHAHDADDQADDAGEKQSVEREKQRLPHGGHKNCPIFIKNIYQGNPAPFRHTVLTAY